MTRNLGRSVCVSLGCVAILLLFSATAFAATLTNPGFENGLTGWTVTGGASVVPSHTAGDGVTVFLPQSGSFFLRLNGGCNENTVSQTISMSPGQKVRGFAAFAAHETDAGYNDDAAVRILDGTMAVVATPFFSSISMVGSITGFTPWTPWSFTAPSAGSFTVQYMSANRGDCGVPSSGLFDSSGKTLLYAGRSGSSLVALLLGAADGTPVVGVPVVFTCGVCAPGSYTAITNSAGIARTVPLPQASLAMATQGKWKAAFNGNGTWDPSTTTVLPGGIPNSGTIGTSSSSTGAPAIFTARARPQSNAAAQPARRR